MNSPSRRPLPVLVMLLALGGCAPPDPRTTDDDGDGLSEEDGDCDDSNPEFLLESSDGVCGKSYERMVLNEVFTGSNCGPCLGADAQILDVLHANEGRYVLISYQIGSDPYISDEGVRRRFSYLPPGSGSYSIPWVQADGVNGFHPVEVNDDQGYLDTDFDRFAALPCHLGLQMDVTQEDQTVSASITITPGTDYESEDLVLHTVIIEGTTFLNVGSNGQTEFHHVMKKMLPDQNGLAIAPLVYGEEVTYEQSWTFQGEYDDTTGIDDRIDHSSAHTVEEFDDLSVIAFVQDSETLQVHQSRWSGH